MRKYVSTSNFTGKLFYLFINDTVKTFSIDTGFYEDEDIKSIDRLGFYDIVNGLISQNYTEIKEF